VSKYRYHGNCVGNPPENVPILIKMCDDATDITRRTFLRHVDREDLQEVETALGYVDHPSKGLTMAGDYHVTYHRSRWDGCRCYFFCWSAIEYFFVAEDNVVGEDDHEHIFRADGMDRRGAWGYCTPCGCPMLKCDTCGKIVEDWDDNLHDCTGGVSHEEAGHRETFVQEVPVPELRA